jgi:hypothetical protein
VEVGDAVFERAQDDFVDLPDCPARVAQRGGVEILRREGAAVEQVPAALPMRLGLVGLPALPGSA